MKAFGVLSAVVLVLGGGMGMVSRASAQFVGDPTPENPFVCPGVYVAAGLPVPTWPNNLDPRNCTPAPSGLTPLGEFETWISTSNLHIPDRRPAIHIQIYDGTWSQNDPRGVNEFWEGGENLDGFRLSTNRTQMLPGGNNVPDQFDWLTTELESRYANGWRRFILRLPAGVAFGTVIREAQQPDPELWGGHTQSMNQWGAMPTWRQNWMVQTCQQFLSRHPRNNNNPNDPNNITLEVYIGFNVGAGSCTTCVNRNNIAVAGANPETIIANVWTGIRQDGVAFEVPRAITVCGSINSGAAASVGLSAVDFSPRRQDHLNVAFAEFIGWHSAGFRKIWLDTGGDNFNVEGRRKRWAFLELANNPYFRSVLGLRFGGEPLPYIGDNRDSVDDCSLRFAPFFTESNPVTTWDQQVRTFIAMPLQLSKGFSEVLLSFNPTRPGEPEFTFAEVGEAIRRGYVLAPYNSFARTEELVRRWYSMGRIRVADFDGDGDVDPSDREQLVTAINTHNANPPGVPISIPIVFATGDINQDGAIGPADLAEYDFRKGRDLIGDTANATIDYGIAQTN
jgi:hypothetical protein